MVFIDGAGAATWPPLYYSAAGAVQVWDVTVISPDDGERVPFLQPTLRVLVSASGGGPSSVQFDVATDAAFTAIVWTSTDAAAVNGPRDKVVGVALTNGTRYYWRARDGNGGGTWGQFTATRSFIPDLNAGRAYLEVFANVGIEELPDGHGFLSLYENVGAAGPPLHPGYHYEYVNVGADLVKRHQAYHDVFEGDVSTNTPTPLIWFLAPESGRPGDGIKIYGFGTGPLQSTFGGVVEAYFGAATGWVSVPVLSWGVFPETPNAYTAARKIDPVAGIIDPQHSVIEIVVSPAALPPGYPIRIRTEGP